MIIDVIHFRHDSAKSKYIWFCARCSENSCEKKKIRVKGSHFGKKLYLCSQNHKTTIRLWKQLSTGLREP